MITKNNEETPWFVGGQVVGSIKIEKHTLNFEAKTYWTLARHKLCPTTRDNILSPVCATLVAKIMVGYVFDVS